MLSRCQGSNPADWIMWCISSRFTWWVVPAALTTAMQASDWGLPIPPAGAAPAP